MKKIGLLGGSFDPPHKGHIFISLEAKKLLSLDEIWWLITPQNPHKVYKPATYHQRLNNCLRIIKNCPIKIKEYEKDINSKYSYATIRFLCNKYNFIKFFWLMGADNVISFHKWQNWKQIFEKVSIVVFKRQGYNSSALKSITNKQYLNYHINLDRFSLNKFNRLPSWSMLNNKEINISSTEIRNQQKNLRG